jgi:formate/nitrite transporter FocA (FNT family)
MKNFKLFISATLAGILFAIGTAAYLYYASSTPVLAALILAGSFLAIGTLNLDLFTDKAGYMFYAGTESDKNLVKALITVLGNIVGAVVVALALLGSGVTETIAPTVVEKFDNIHYTMFASSVICGMLTFVAAHGYKRLGGGFSGCLLIAFSTVAFVILGAEHTLIDVFCITSALHFTAESVLHVLIILVGNFAGAILFAEGYELKKSKNEHHYHERRSSRRSHRSKSEAEE